MNLVDCFTLNFDLQTVLIFQFFFPAIQLYSLSIYIEVLCFILYFPGIATASYGRNTLPPFTNSLIIEKQDKCRNDLTSCILINML